MTLIERWILVGLGLGGAFALGYGARSYEQHREHPYTAVAAVPQNMMVPSPSLPSSTRSNHEWKEVAKTEPIRPTVEFKKEERKLETIPPSQYRTPNPFPYVQLPPGEVLPPVASRESVKKEERKVEHRDPPSPAISPNPSLVLPPIDLKKPARKEEKKTEERLPQPRIVSPSPILLIPQVSAAEPGTSSIDLSAPLQSREPDLIIQAVKNIKSNGEIPVDPKGMDFQLIKNTLNIKTTILDEAKPAIDLPVLKNAAIELPLPFGLYVPNALLRSSAGDHFMLRTKN